MKKLSLIIAMLSVTLSTGYINAAPTTTTTAQAQPNAATAKEATVQLADGVIETKNSKLVVPTTYEGAIAWYKAGKETSPRKKPVFYTDSEKHATSYQYSNGTFIASPVKTDSSYVPGAKNFEMKDIDFTGKVNLFFQPNTTLKAVQDKLHLHQGLVDEMLKHNNLDIEQNIKEYGGSDLVRNYMYTYAKAETCPVMYIETTDLNNKPDYISVLGKDGDIRVMTQLKYVLAANKAQVAAAGIQLLPYTNQGYLFNSYMVNDKNEVAGLGAGAPFFDAKGNKVITSILTAGKNYTPSNVTTLIYPINIAENSQNINGSTKADGTPRGRNDADHTLAFVIVHKVNK